MQQERLKARARLANAAQRAKRDPGVQGEVDAARRDYRFIAAEEYIRGVVAGAPPLNQDQRSRLAMLLLRGEAA